MTRREQCNFILHVFLPAIERDGMTIKTRFEGELSLSAGGSVTENLIRDLRQHCLEQLRQAAPASLYGSY